MRGAWHTHVPSIGEACIKMEWNSAQGPTKSTAFALYKETAELAMSLCG